MVVVISIIALLLTIISPALIKARFKAKNFISSNNQKQFAISLMLYAADNRDRLPDSVAVISSGPTWNWHDPRKLVTSHSLHSGSSRSVAQYLNSYLTDHQIINSPHVPTKDNIISNLWQQGDSWDHPDTFMPDDQFVGSYCLYWNYMGCFDKQANKKFYGPTSLYNSKKYSKLLISDYLGYGHWTQKQVFGSSVKFKGSDKTDDRDNFISWWAGKKTMPNIVLQAAYLDGSVKNYSSADTIALWIAMSPHGRKIYDENLGMGPGMLFIPPE